MKPRNLNAILSITEHLDRQYNPENDLMPNAPRVTATDNYLLTCIKYLAEIALDLQTQLDALEKTK